MTTLGKSRAITPANSVAATGTFTACAAAHALGKIDEVALIGLGAEAIEDHHISVTWIHDAEDADVATQFNQAPTQRMLGLKADDDDGVSRIFDAIAQVIAARGRLLSAAHAVAAGGALIRRTLSPCVIRRA